MNCIAFDTVLAAMVVDKWRSISHDSAVLFTDFKSFLLRTSYSLSKFKNCLPNLHGVHLQRRKKTTF